jgi:hypothetical protein
MKSKLIIYSIAGLLLLWSSLFNSPSTLSDPLFNNIPLPAEKHPFVYFTSDELPAINAKIQREPYKSWFASLEEKADSYLNTSDMGRDHEERMKRAKELAFCYSITAKEPYAEIATEYLMYFQDNPPFKQGDNYPIRYARVIFDACAAYDMIYGYLEHHPDINSQLRKKLAKGAQAFHDFTPSWYAALRNNWGIRQYSGLGLAALTLADGVESYDPKTWWDKSEKQMLAHFKSQITPVDGAWCESYSYIAYAADLYLPYAHARRRLTGDNWLTNELIAKTHRWAVDVMLPDGLGPIFDDSNHSRFPFEQLTQNSDNPGLYKWAYMQADGTPAGINNVDAICNYDDSPEPKRPDDPPSRFLPEGGNMVFRSGWDKDAVYGLFLGEYGQARVNGGGHEHPDVTSFQIFAHGEWFLMDGGYGGWEDHKRVNTSDNHNLILVDGKGPVKLKIQGTDLWSFGDGKISEYEQTTEIEKCRIDASYQGCDISRTVLFFRYGMFVIYDQVKSDKDHDYTWLYHMNAGFDTGNAYEETANGMIVQGKNADMSLEVYPEGEKAVFSTRSDEHAFRNGKFNQHVVREVKIKGRDVNMLSLINISAHSDRQSYRVERSGNKVRIILEGGSIRGEITLGPGKDSSDFKFVKKN